MTSLIVVVILFGSICMAELFVIAFLLDCIARIQMKKNIKQS
jgi:hypothetical protein